MKHGQVFHFLPADVCGYSDYVAVPHAGDGWSRIQIISATLGNVDGGEVSCQ